MIVSGVLIRKCTTAVSILAHLFDDIKWLWLTLRHCRSLIARLLALWALRENGCFLVLVILLSLLFSQIFLVDHSSDKIRPLLFSVDEYFRLCPFSFTAGEVKLGQRQRQVAHLLPIMRDTEQYIRKHNQGQEQCKEQQSSCYRYAISRLSHLNAVLGRQCYINRHRCIFPKQTWSLSSRQCPLSICWDVSVHVG